MNYRLDYSLEIVSLDLELEQKSETTITTLPVQLGLPATKDCPQFTDMTLEIGTHQYNVHRAIMSCRCEWIKKQLGSSQDEAAQVKLNLDVGKAAADALVLYLYSEQVDQALPIAVCRDLVKLAMAMDIPDLCERIETLCSGLLTLTNIEDYATFADENVRAIVMRCAGSNN